MWCFSRSSADGMWALSSITFIAVGGAVLLNLLKRPIVAFVKHYPGDNKGEAGGVKRLEGFLVLNFKDIGGVIDGSGPEKGSEAYDPRIVCDVA